MHCCSSADLHCSLPRALVSLPASLHTVTALDCANPLTQSPALKPFTREPFSLLEEINIYGLARLLAGFVKTPDQSCQLQVCIKDSVVSIKAAYCQISSWSSRKNTGLDERRCRLLQRGDSGSCCVAILSHEDGISYFKKIMLRQY